MVSFKLRGICIGLDFSFFAVVGVFLAFDKSGYGIYCLCACFCHELGHLLVMLAEKKLPEEIIFSGGGICIKQRYDASALVLGAGCAVNFCLFALFCLILPKDSIYKLLFGGANLVIGIFNLLPMGELDGRRLLEKMCYKLLPYFAAERLLNITETACCLLSAAAALLLLFTGAVNLTAVSVTVYLFLIDFLLKTR
ncbi:MAG: hypothetical protein HDT46_00860 [Ruminococcaceae bacterium]|nr:hypothetical protein [Oscillospiraceae bacterium]